MPDVLYPDLPERPQDEQLAARLAARPLDSIILPLLAPLAEFLARCEELPAWASESDRELCAEMVRIAEEDPGSSEPAVQSAVMITGLEVVRCAWLLLDELDVKELLTGIEAERVATVADLKKWFEREKPHPARAALVAASWAEWSDTPLFTRPSRRATAMTHALYHYVRHQDVSDWPSASLASRAYWADPEARERLLIAAWSSALGNGLAAQMGRVAAELQLEEQQAEANESDGATATVPSPEDLSREDNADAVMQDRCDELNAELERTSQQLRDAKIAARSAKAERDAARTQLKDVEAERDRQSFYARALVLQLAEVRASLEAGQADDMEPPPDGGWPPDLLAGFAIRLYTGQQRAGVREQMADELRMAGASVEVFDGNGREGVPDIFPADTVVVCDVRFMSHTWSGRLADRARRSGARYIEVRAGQGGLVRAVASAVRR